MLYSDVYGIPKMTLINVVAIKVSLDSQLVTTSFGVVSETIFKRVKTISIQRLLLLTIMFLSSLQN